MYLMRILFTPLGGSDPIKRMLDGPMLHCLRVYRPDVVYMYFTDKILEYERRDSRYSWAAEKLGEKLGHKFEIKRIEREGLTEVQRFDSFYDDFENIFDEMQNSYPDAEIYVNASSGTPAIKSAIVITAAMSKSKINVIQVSSGEKHPLHDRDDDNNYDKEEQWECDIDNTNGFKDRTSIVKSDRFLVKVKKENIRKHISAYDYHAAAESVKEIKDYITEQSYRLIKAAEKRMTLDYNGVKNALKGMDENIIPIKKDDKKRNITEYILWLGVTLKKGDYLSFIRGITPIAMVLMESTVERFTEIGDIKNYCENKNGHYNLTAKKLRESEIGIKILNILNKAFNKNGFRDGEYTTAHLEPIIAGFCKDKEVCGYANVIRKAEQKLRNEAAHTIIAVDDNIIKERIGITSSVLYNTIWKMAVCVRLVSDDIKNSYDDMNEYIIEKLFSTKI